jgi:hypothetical protein
VVRVDDLAHLEEAAARLRVCSIIRIAT